MGDHDNRRVHLSQSLDNQWFLDGLLDPISGEIVNTVLTGIERELFEADWAAAMPTGAQQPKPLFTILVGEESFARTCTHPYCNEPVQQCQVDHIQPWAQGGETSLDNGRLRCGFHNRHDTRPPDG